MYYPVETRITALTSIRRERLLPLVGEIVAAPGDEVQATDIVARCQFPVNVHAVDVSRELGIARDIAAECISTKAGETVRVDQIIATSPGSTGVEGGECRSPVEGRVLEMRGGIVLIQTETAFELLAGIRGVIASVVPNRGVIVSTQGALVQGLWGSGPEVVGNLTVPLDGPHEPLRSEHVDATCERTLLVAGRILDRAVFERAAEVRVGGIVVGSASADLIPWLRSLPFSIMVTDGFGSFPMSDPTFSLLRSHAGLEATLCAEVRTPEGAGRPELLIPKPDASEQPADAPGPIPLREGMRVRGLRQPYLGMMGTVRALPSNAYLVESGARLPVAEVELEPEGGTVLIPVANLEIIR